MPATTAIGSAEWWSDGRDAVDVALITSFGPATLTEFEVRAA